MDQSKKKTFNCKEFKNILTKILTVGIHNKNKRPRLVHV